MHISGGVKPDLEELARASREANPLLYAKLDAARQAMPD
jgi:hypothetical protein